MLPQFCEERLVLFLAIGVTVPGISSNFIVEWPYMDEKLRR